MRLSRASFRSDAKLARCGLRKGYPNLNSSSLARRRHNTEHAASEVSAFSHAGKAKARFVRRVDKPVTQIGNGEDQLAAI